MASKSALEPLLLCDATWFGTLAATWDVGSRGVPVTLACDALIAPARLSRFVSQTVRCPPSKSLAFADWLLEFARRSPPHVLYPTSDEVAWHVAAHREELAKSFKVFSPPLEALIRVLDKAQLAEHGRRAGLDVPETRCPRDEAEVERIGKEMAFPVYVKPRAQVLAEGVGKGTKVKTAEELMRAWREARATTRIAAEVARAIPGVEFSIVQASLPGSERIYTVDGFIDESGQNYACLACTKLLQRPRGSGPGIIFEHSPLDPKIAEGLRRLCLSTGFYGVFDAEFVSSDGRMLLIDFNPRFYNHMVFEVDRGLPLPWLAYLSARGDREAVKAITSQAGPDGVGPRAYAFGQSLSLLLTFQALAGAMPREERRAWRNWVSSHGALVSDPVRRKDDPWPQVGAMAMEVSAFVRHPRSYLRSLIRGRA